MLGMMKYRSNLFNICLLYTSDAADERSSVDLGGRRIIKKKNHVHDDAAVIMTINNSIRNTVELIKYI